MSTKKIDEPRELSCFLPPLPLSLFLLPSLLANDFEVFITYARVPFLPVEALYKTNLLHRRMHIVTAVASANTFVHFSQMTLLEFRLSMGRYF